MGRILVVEDERDVKDLIVLHLKRDGHEVTSVENGEDALRFFESQAFDLAVLDWMLPGISGLELCKKMVGKLPILMVTARADAADVVLGLEMGADDFVTKPFEIPVFLARVRSLLRRARIGSAGQKTADVEKITVGDLTVDLAAHEARSSEGAIKLTPSEFKLLVALLKNSGRVLSRDRLIDLVQGEGVVVVDRAIDTHVFGLRKKLGKCAEIIETIRGVGYRVKSE